jgi:hypothetical protein
MAPIPVIEPGAGHAVGRLFEKLFLQTAEFFNEVVGLVNQADGDVGDDFRRAGFHKRAVKFIGLRNFAPKSPDIEGLLGVFVPFMVFTPAQVKR